MDSQRVIYLYQLYLDRNLSPQELDEFKELVLDPDQEHLLDKPMKAHWNHVKETRAINLSIDKSGEIFSSIVKYQPKPKRRIILWPRFMAIASIIVLMISGIYFFQNSKTVVNLVDHDIRPGKVGATLTLASGKKIKLSAVANGEIAKEAGVTVTKTADGQLSYQIKGNTSGADKINTLSTEKGETYLLTLPDQSKVWLNAASSLTYTASFNRHGNRIVKLSGEAYFEVTKDSEHPFVVESKGQRVEVLGTHFNINSYPGETSVKTTLLEGSVRIAQSSLSGTTSVPGAGNVILKPNEQAVFENRTIKVRAVVADDAIAWKNGYFMFDSDNLENVMTRIARWYNIQPFYEDESLKQEVFLGTISKYERISQVLHMLERTGGVSFKIEGKKVIISRNK
ncbi:fec operon regulator FecR [compost metagenome]